MNMYPDHDPTQGWVSAQEIRNVFQEYKRRLDQMLKGSLSPDVIFKFYESTEYELYRRTTKNLAEYQKAQPKTVLVKKADIPDSRENHQKRLQGIREKA